MNISKAVKVAERLHASFPNKSETSEAIQTLIDLGKKVTTRRPPFKQVPGMAVCVMIRSLLKAKDLQAPVQITDTEGSFTDDQIITVDETQDGEEVNIVVQYVKL